MSGSLVNDWSCVYPTAEQQIAEENARQYARIFFEETERLRAEKVKQEEADRRKHAEHCRFLSQFQPKKDYSNIIEKQLLEVACKERETNPDKHLCEINHTSPEDIIERRIEVISESFRRACFCDCD